MVDHFSQTQRSEIMRKVRSTGNQSTELKLIKYFKTNKITGWRRHYPLVGKPDFVFPKLRIVIFVDGCFWHGHNCRKLTPIANADYWKLKIERNKQRDIIVTQVLINKKWDVMRIWECEIAHQLSEDIVIRLKK